jgi:putative transcriptional regulator
MAKVRPAPRVTGGAIARLRTRLKLSQPVFAQALNVSAETVRAWEQEKRTPDGAALRLLQVAERHPEVVLENVRRRSA